MIEEDGLAWYQRQRAQDAESRALSEPLLGRESQVFTEAMACTAGSLHAVTKVSPIRDLATVRIVSLAHYGYNLLWAAWDEMLAGRYDVGAAFQRSVSEVPDFIGALIANPGLAEHFGEFDVHAARRAIRDGLNAAEPGKGKEWHQLRQGQHKATQAFSHVSLDSVNRSLAVLVAEEKKVGVLRPGGIVAPINLKLTAVPLAAAAVLHFGAVAMGLFPVPGVAQVWEQRGRRLLVRVAETLSEELRTVDAPPGEVAEVFLAAEVSQE